VTSRRKLPNEPPGRLRPTVAAELDSLSAGALQILGVAQNAVHGLPQDIRVDVFATANNLYRNDDCGAQGRHTARIAFALGKRRHDDRWLPGKESRLAGSISAVVNQQLRVIRHGKPGKIGFMSTIDRKRKKLPR